MKNALIVSIITVVIYGNSFAQTQQAPSFILNQPISGNHHYQASQYIKMGISDGNSTGFNYTAGNNCEYKAEINPYLIFPPEGGEIGGPIGNTTVGNDGVVGTTKGSFTVNDAGSAVYQVPLEFPGGLSGMTPELSLVYNSSGPDGILGPGWSISGLSVITCVPATRFHDGIKRAAYGNDYEEGAYTLDGQRLVPIVYDDVSNYREYRTELDVFSKIMRKSVSGGQRADEAGKYFEVKTKSGLTYIYGKTPESKHRFTNPETNTTYTVSYYVNSIIDNMGNMINFIYDNNLTEGEIRILKIEYTIRTNDSGGDTDPIYRISFDYKERPDVLTYYLSSETGSNNIRVKTSTSKVIEFITCTHVPSNTLVKKYALTYISRGLGSDNTSKILHLSSIKEFGKSGSSNYNKTIFDWEEEITSMNFVKSELIVPPIDPEGVYVENKNLKYAFLDIDNDGKDEIVRTYQTKETINHEQEYFYFELEILKKSSTGYTIENSYRHSDFKNYIYFIEPNVSFGDFNGDGLSDLAVTFYSDSSSVCDSSTKMLVSYNDGSKFGEPYDFLEEEIIETLGTFLPMIGDYNGDGMADVCLREDSGNLKWRLGNVIDPLSSNQDIQGSITLTYDAQLDLFNSKSIVEITDLNGDGRTDFILRNDVGNSIEFLFLKPDPNNSDNIVFSYIPNSLTLNKKYTAFPYLNNDRKSDFIKIKTVLNGDFPGSTESFEYNVEIDTYLGSGKGYEEIDGKHQVLTLLASNPLVQYCDYFLVHGETVRIIPLDYNGDNLNDFLVQIDLHFYGYREQYQQEPIIVEERTESIVLKLFSTTKRVFLCTGFGAGAIENLYIADLNKDNQTDTYIIRSNNIYNQDTIVVSTPTTILNKIISITDGLGSKINIEYSFTNDPELYTSGAVVDYPAISYDASRSLVKSVKRDNGLGGFSDAHYKYEKARAHAEGLGFIGFERLIKQDITNNIETITEYDFDKSYFAAYPVKQTRKIINGPVLEETINTYEVNDYVSSIGEKKYYFIQPLEVRTFQYELKPNNIESYNYKGSFVTYSPYDSYGNPTTITQKTEDYTGTSTEVFQRTTTHLYYPADEFSDIPNNIHRWVIGRLKESSTTFVAPECDAITKKSFFVYYNLEDGDKYGMLKEERVYRYNSDNILTTKTYTHDDFGNIKTSTTAATGLASIINITNYSTDGRFLEYVINPIGFITNNQYDPILASLRFKIDVDNNLTTEFINDDFGRNQKCIEPDGKINVSVLRWVTQDDNNAPNYAVYYTWQQTSGKPPVITYYNNLGMELRSVTYDFNNEVIYVDTYYNEKGQVWKKSLPYELGTESPTFGVNVYDLIGRLKTVTVPTESGNAITTITYDGFTTKTQNALNQVSSKTLNAAGWLAKSTDAAEESIIHTYYADGAIKSICVEEYENTCRSYLYDDAGHLLEYEDASQGKTTYNFNAYGQLTYEINAVGERIDYPLYDQLGRLRSKTTKEGIFTYEYDLIKKGMLDYVSCPTETVSYTYDDFLRPLTETHIIQEGTFITQFAYDELGRLQDYTYPSGYKIRNTYTENGFLLSIIDTEDGNKLWQATMVNSRGKYKNVKIGDFEQTFEYYQYSDRIKKIEANGLQNNYYVWDKIGNLKNRYTKLGKPEYFEYDNLNRLEKVYHNGQLSFSYGYDAIGNLIFKSDVGDYAYGDLANPYKLTSINNVPITINNDNQHVYYNSFNKVYKIEERDPITDILKRQLDLIYGVDNSRIKQIITSNGQVNSIKLYIGKSYEVETKDGATNLIHYVVAPTGLVAIVTKADGNKKIEFALNDHLGSLQVLATRSGELIQEFSYDAWGMRRDPITFAVFSVVPNTGATTGFTGHEHIDLFLLINMDGRMYDPVLGRFLSPDPVLQFPDFTQGLNPYSYALNNPLRYTDPTGYSLVGQLIATGLSILVAPYGGPVVSAFVYTVVMTIDYAVELGRAANFKNLSSYFIQTFVMSTISAGSTNLIGNIFAGLKDNSVLELYRAMAHGTLNGGMRMLQGGKFEHGFLSGFVSSLCGSYFKSSDLSFGEKVAIAAVIGGTTEAVGGGKFANGAVTGAYVMALNHLSLQNQLDDEYIITADELRADFTASYEEIITKQYVETKVYNIEGITPEEIAGDLLYSQSLTSEKHKFLLRPVQVRLATYQRGNTNSSEGSTIPLESQLITSKHFITQSIYPHVVLFGENSNWGTIISVQTNIYIKFAIKYQVDVVP